MVHKTDILYKGDIRESAGGYGSYVIIEDRSAREVYIKFLNTGYTTLVWRSSAKQGKVKDYLVPEVYRVGYNSMGKLKGISTNPKMKQGRGKWEKMLGRCYCEENKRTNPTYVKCSVREDWHDFANFYRWYEVACDTKGKLKFHLDKDLIFKGNTVYSEETCFLVPRKLNNLICSKSSNKNTDSPVGVHLKVSSGLYQAHCNPFDDKDKRVKLGEFPTKEEAFSVYKPFKESVIKEAAIFYKKEIDPRLYEILINYEVTKEDHNEQF